ncbi:MAG: hypothetical protein A4E73_02361 [Syntrophaceae bacterium PtaU1.Bin231]|nr:MAG: hypothetical protein A4E73_02361 [Syntrophaceae bacterium PtaU1.Bin231]
MKALQLVYLSCLLAAVLLAGTPQTLPAQSVCQIQAIRPVHVDANLARIQVQYYIAPSHPKPCFIGAYTPAQANQNPAFGMRPAGLPSGVPKGQHGFQDNIFFEIVHNGRVPTSTESIEVVIYDGDGNLCKAAQPLRRAWGSLPYTFLGDYPKDREPGWSDECQGVTHDEKHWYITQKGTLWKFPVTFNLNEGISRTKREKGIWNVDIPRFLRDEGYNHFSHLDYYNGRLYVPLEGRQPCKIVVFEPERLNYVVEGDLDARIQDHAPWCAINPADNLLYTSNSDNNSGLFLYRHEIKDGKLELRYARLLHLYDERGNPIKIHSVQGGAFSKKTGLLYISSDRGKDGGIFVFDPKTGIRVGVIRVAYSQSRYGEELEGLTVWDLDAAGAPGIKGQVHLIMIDNWGTGDDDLYFKHFSVPMEK